MAPGGCLCLYGMEMVLFRVLIVLNRTLKALGQQPARQAAVATLWYANPPERDVWPWLVSSPEGGQCNSSASARTNDSRSGSNSAMGSKCYTPTTHTHPLGGAVLQRNPSETRALHRCTEARASQQCKRCRCPLAGLGVPAPPSPESSRRGAAAEQTPLPGVRRPSSVGILAPC